MSFAGFTAPARLTIQHNLVTFDCGTPSLNEWLTGQALKNEASGASRTYVVSIGDTVIGYYCLATGAIARDEAPKPMQRNMPNPIPVMVLGRLAVDQTYQDQGIGKALLLDAIMRTLQVSEIVGVKAILVHAISEEAKHYYLARNFLESPINPMTLCLRLETARAALAE